MITWFSENLGTIFVVAVLVVIVALILHGLIRDKKQGKHLCGGDCAHCGGACHMTAAPAHQNKSK